MSKKFRTSLECGGCCQTSAGTAVTLNTPSESKLEAPEIDMGRVIADLNEQFENTMGAHLKLQNEGALTQSLAAESIGYLGSDVLLKTYYGPQNKTQKYQIATETLQQKIKDLIKIVYDIVMKVVKKCIEWVKQLYAKLRVPPKEKIKDLKKAIDEVEPAAREAKQVSPRTAKGILVDGGQAKYFFDGLDKREFDLLVGGTYSAKVVEIATQVQHSNAVGELDQAMTALSQWYEKMLTDAQALERTREIQSASADKKDKQALFDAAISAGAIHIVNGNRSDTDALQELFFTAKDEEAKLPHPKLLESAYDLNGFFNEATRIVGRLDSEAITDALVKWRDELNRIEAVLNDSRNKAEKALRATEHDPNAQSLADVHEEFFNMLNAFPQRIMNMNQIVLMIYRYYDDSAYLFLKMLVYISEAAGECYRVDREESMGELQRTAAEVVKRLRHQYE